MAKIRFTQKSRYPNDVKIDIDGVDITNSVHSININAAADSLTTVFLGIYPCELEIDCDDVKVTTKDMTIRDMVSALAKEVGETLGRKRFKDRGE